MSTADNPQPFQADFVEQMFAQTPDLGQLYHSHHQAHHALTQAHGQVLWLLLRALETRQPQACAHAACVGRLSQTLALTLDQSAAWARQLSMAAPLHEVGTLGVPDAVLNKDGPLDRTEREHMQRHPTMGAYILGDGVLADAPLLALAAEVARTHHERHDGKGYPAGLAGEDIPLSGRIVSLISVFDALTTDRSYRRAFSDTEALDMVVGQRGRGFDPVVVDAFAQHFPALSQLRRDVLQRGLAYTDLLYEAML